jgi:hypothetical protein
MLPERHTSESRREGQPIEMVAPLSIPQRFRPDGEGVINVAARLLLLKSKIANDNGESPSPDPMQDNSKGMAAGFLLFTVEAVVFSLKQSMIQPKNFPSI